ncbi:MAG: hypothetical protein H7A55_18240 [Verrucomicrobiaceae bacterium]|nr:hypothetical protein [Verrucomicrobiaceae bacterium]
MLRALHPSWPRQFFYGIGVAGITVLLCHCSSFAPALSAGQRPDLTRVVIATPRFASNAYTQPSGIDTSISDKWASRAERWSGGDSIVGLVGGIVSNSIALGQQTDFVSRNANSFAQAEATLRRNIGPCVQRATHTAAQTSVIAPRLAASGPSRIHSTIRQFGLVRTGTDRNEEVTLSPQVRIDYTLTNDQGQTVFAWTSPPITSTHGYPLYAYATNANLLVNELTNACDQAARQFKVALNQSLRR